MAMVLPHRVWHKPDSCSRSSCRRFPGPHRSHCISVAAKLSIQVACQNTIPGSWLGTSQKECYGVSGGRGADRHVNWLVCRTFFCSFPAHPGARYFPLLPGTAPGGSHHSWPCLTAIIPPASLTIKEEIKQLEYLGFKYRWFEMKMSSWGIAGAFQRSVILIPCRQHGFCPDQEKLQITAHLITAWILVVKTKIIN